MRSVAEVFVKKFLAKFGALGNQGRNFESHLFSEMCKLLGIKKTRTSVYNPLLDGMVEGFRV